MYRKVYFDEFVEAFKAAGLYHRFGGDDGLEALWEHLLRLEKDLGEEFELDPRRFATEYDYMDIEEAAEFLGVPKEEVVQYLMDNDVFVAKIGDNVLFSL